MARTDEDLVGGIIEVDPDIDLAPFIETANELVTELCAPVTNDDGDPFYSDARLELIERWLAAHFYCMHEPRATYEQAGPVSERVESKVDLGLSMSRYGQQAMILDTYGALRNLNEGKANLQPGLGWLGTRPEDY